MKRWNFQEEKDGFFRRQFNTRVNSNVLERQSMCSGALIDHSVMTSDTIYLICFPE
jgi:hypothetical protein